MDNQNIENLDELQKNELDDIVLEKYEKKERLKKYALIGGSVLLVFIIVLSIVKLLNDSSSTPQDRLVDTQEIPQENVNDEESNYEEIPIEEESSSEETLNDVANEVKEKENSLQQPIQQTPPITKTLPQKPVQKKIEPSAPKQKKEQKVSQQTANHKKEKKVSKEEPPKKKDHNKTKKIAKGNIYIQVGAFLKYDPDQKFLQKIKRAGFDYTIKTFHLNGKRIKRVYVGPFSSKAKAREALYTVKRKISKNAFITKVR